MVHTAVPQRSDIPLAIIQGSPITEAPSDLYIPPDSLRIFLESFEGPFDLLLYLIKRQNLDILDIPVAEVTAQYIKFIELMEDLQLELAGEYLLMAAMLAEIKSTMLLPTPVLEETVADPRAELVRRLQEYERYRSAANSLDQLPRYEREIFPCAASLPDLSQAVPLPTVTLTALLQSFAEVLRRTDLVAHHHIQFSELSVRERMTQMLKQISRHEFTQFSDLFSIAEGRIGIIVSFLAMLELLKESLIEVVQNEVDDVIYLQAAA